MVARKWEDWEDIGVTANGYRVSFWNKKNVLKLDSDDAPTSLNILKTT